MAEIKNQRGIVHLVLLVAVGVVVIGGTGVVVASDRARTGDLLFGVEEKLEDMSLIFANVEDRAKIRASIASERLAELESLVDSNVPTDRLTEAAANYEEQLAEALAKAEEARSQGKDTEEVMTIISENTLRHQNTLTEVATKVPAEAQAAITRAQASSQRGFEEASSALSSEKLEEAIENVQREIPNARDFLPEDAELPDQAHDRTN